MASWSEFREELGHVVRGYPALNEQESAELKKVIFVAPERPIGYNDEAIDFTFLQKLGGGVMGIMDRFTLGVYFGTNKLNPINLKSKMLGSVGLASAKPGQRTVKSAFISPFQDF